MASNTKLAIELVNKARTALHLEPILDLPKGKKSKANSCPIARGLNNCFDVYTVKLWSTQIDKEIIKSIATSWKQPYYFYGYGHKHIGRYKIICPQELIDWIKDFDDGEYPEYEE